MKVAVAAVGLLAFVPLSVRAQAPDDFGIQDEAITVIGQLEFQQVPQQAFQRVSASIDRANALNGTRSIIGPLTFLAPIQGLPNGAVLTQLVAYIHDTSAVDDVTVALCWDWVHSATGASWGSGCLPDVHSTGSPGDTYLQQFPNFPFIYRQDVDGDGVDDVVNYYIVAFTGIADTSIRMVRLRWKRQVSPAPQTATFGDVPTNHLFFQFVEALADSGITAGCGGGNYCPDAPLTRGQMAVFLAKGLGLHWPWNAQ